MSSSYTQSSHFTQNYISLYSLSSASLDVGSSVYPRRLSHLDVVQDLGAAVGGELGADNDHNVFVPASVTVELDRRPAEARHCGNQQNCQ